MLPSSVLGSDIKNIFKTKYTASLIIIVISTEEVKGRATATAGEKLKLKKRTMIFF